MSAVIYKYLLNGNSTAVPQGRVLLVAQQSPLDTFPTVWVVHRLPLDGKTMDLEIYGTGHTVPGDRTSYHVGSCICGPFVWHVYVNRSSKVPS